METPGVHRPRNVDWKRAASLLYGDWGTSKAYVIGFAFSGGAAAVAFSSMPIILAVCLLTALVAYSYVIVCKHFPDGGGVYSAARDQSRVLAAMGALLLVANFSVTAAMSGWSALSYFRVPEEFVRLATMGAIVAVGAINYFGPKHTGSLAVTLALPMVLVVVLIIGWSLPHLSTSNFEPLNPEMAQNWLAFTGMILALSGVEAVANLTGVMKLDPNATMDSPSVGQTSKKAILVVAVEVVLGTMLLGWAMLSLPKELEETVLRPRWEDMLSVLAEQYGKFAYGESFGHVFGIITGILVGVLLISAVNTAVGALIGLLYMMSRDGEMPAGFGRLNSHGVPWWPLIISTVLPFLVVAFAKDLASLMGLYAIGVVGAIAVNLGCSAFNRRLDLAWHERTIMAVTFLVLFGVEVTVAKTKGDALFFAVCVLGVGFALRAFSLKRAGLTSVMVREDVAAHVAPETAPDFRIKLGGGHAILVAARGVTPVLRFAIEEAKLRSANLYILYVKEIAVALPGRPQRQESARWQDDTQATKIITHVLEMGRQNDVPVVPVYSVSEDPAATILDLSATLGVDFLMLGSSHRRALTSLLKGNVVHEVAKNLPENIQLIIHS